jgi:hypothetical protein
MTNSQNHALVPTITSFISITTGLSNKKASTASLNGGGFIMCVSTDFLPIIWSNNNKYPDKIEETEITYIKPSFSLKKNQIAVINFGICRFYIKHPNGYQIFPQIFKIIELESVLILIPQVEVVQQIRNVRQNYYSIIQNYYIKIICCIRNLLNF